MKKISKTIYQLVLAGAGVMAMASCGNMVSTNSSASAGNILGEVLGAATNGQTIGNILSSVLGNDKPSQQELIATWRYAGPGCAFTSDNALAKAGGEVAATEVKNKLQAEYSRLGFSSSNTWITFSNDGTFSSKILGKSFSGKYTYNASTAQITLQGLLLNLNGYVKRDGRGIDILFESKKILTLLQTVAAMSGNSSIQTIGDLSKNYDGVRIGFAMK